MSRSDNLRSDSPGHVIGIDFGTTNSCVSVYDPRQKKVKVVPNPIGTFTTASCVFFDATSTDVLVGESSICHSKNVVHNVKRLVGKTYTDLTSDTDLSSFFKHLVLVKSKGDSIGVKLQYANDTKVLSVAEIVTTILVYLRQCAESHLGSVERCVMTVPAYFTDAQREVMRSCCKQAGMECLRLLNEPTAAALAYGIHQTDSSTESTVLVVDCGGGTTDFSVVTMDYEEQVYEVKFVVGDNFLGGEDVTTACKDFVVNALAKNYNIHLTPRQLARLRTDIERAKVALSTSHAVDVHVECGDRDVSLTLTRAQLEECCRNFYARMDEYLLRIVREASAKHLTIHTVVFVGGTTRMAGFKPLLQRVLPHAALCDFIDPDHTVSVGAAFQGALLSGDITCNDGNRNDITLLDVVPMSLGIETAGGIMTPIISRGTVIPVKRTRDFTNTHARTQSIDIDVFQGERRFVVDNTHLTTFRLEGLDANLQKGAMRVRVEFEVDADGVLSATATDLQSGVTAHVSKITVSPVMTSETVVDDADILKLQDSEMERKIVAKLRLYDTFKYFLNAFHEQRDTIFEDPSDLRIQQLNRVFNQAFAVVCDYRSHPVEAIDNATMTLQHNFHTLMYAPRDASDWQGGSTRLDTAIE